MNKIMRYKYWLMMLLVPFWLGCNDEDDIVVKEGLETTYSLPQGNHAYDDEIVEWFEKYGFYTLYIYDKKDIFWANEKWDERVEWQVGGEYRGNAADPDHVGKQLELFKYAFLDIYPDSLLARYMPLKVMLCSELWFTYWDISYDWTTGQTVRTLMYDKIWANSGWDNMSVNGGSLEIDTMGVRSKQEFQYAVNTIFLTRLFNKDKIGMPEGFAQVSNYLSGDYVWGGDDMFARGFVTTGVMSTNVSLLEENQKKDLGSFMRLVGMPMALLEAYPDRKWDDDYYHSVSLIGALHPERDSQGLVRKKYDILIKALKEMGINTDRLQYPEYE